MAKLVWDIPGKRFYETGVSDVALYLQDESGAYPQGVAWSGVSAINESPSGAEPSPYYADNIKYLNLMSAEEYGATVEAYQYPPEFDQCNGFDELGQGVSIGQQTRKPFGLAYKTIKGNDTRGNDFGYKIHLVYGCLAAPSEAEHNTISDSPDPSLMSWEVSTTPVPVTGKKPTSTLVIDSTTVDPGKLAKIEKMLYGDTATEAKLPLPDEIAAVLAEE